MSFDYAKSAATAKRLLAKFGRAVTVTRIAEGAYDPSTGSISTTPTDQTGTGVLLEYSLQEAGVINQAGGLVQANDRKLLLAKDGISVDPLPNDKVTFDGVGYTVVQSKKLAPAGTVVMYELQVRR